MADELLAGPEAHTAIRELVAKSEPPAHADQRGAVAAGRQRRTEARRQRMLGLSTATVDARDLARPLIEVALRDSRAQQMRDWQTNATAVLDMGAVDSKKLLVREKKELLTAVRDNAVALAMLEGHRLDWASSRDAALEAVALEDGSAGRGRGMRIPATPKPHLHAAYARFRLEGVTGGLLEEIEAARMRLPDSNGLPYWSAVYHLMAGQAGSAHAAVADHRADPRIRRVITPLLAPLNASPHQGFPENFYSYLQNFADDWTLHTLGDKLDSFATIAATPPGEWKEDFVKLFDTALDVAVGNAAASEPDPDLLDVDTFAEGRPHTDRASDPRLLAAAARARRNAQRMRDRAAKSQNDATTYTKVWLAANPAALTEFTDAVGLGNRVVGALQGWNGAAQQLRDGRPAKALSGLQDLQLKLTEYFHVRYEDECSAAVTSAEAWSELVRVGTFLKGNAPEVHSGLSKRSSAASLAELYNQDWTMPLIASHGFAPYDDAGNMLNVVLKNPPKISEKMDLPLLVIGLVMAPLGIADCARRLGDPATAIQIYRQLLRFQLTGGLAPLCQIIEVPMVRIQLSHALHDRGDAEYRAGDRVAARQTHQEVEALWQPVGSYVSNVVSGVQSLDASCAVLLAGRQHPLAKQTPALTAAQQGELAHLGRGVPVTTVDVGAREAAGADPSLAPHQALLSWSLPQGSNEANPAIYGLLTRAHARTRQIDAGLNYFGYPNGYIPVERFIALMERARAFTEHAKNAERDYLNFLGQAEEQQYREIGARQAVAVEKSNVAVEQARVDQGRLTATAAQAGAQLAQRTAEDAITRVGKFQAFDVHMQDAEELQMVGAALSGAGAIASGIGSALASGGNPASAIGGILQAAGTIASTAAQQQMAHAQRDLEMSNLELAVGETAASLKVAEAQSAVAQQGFVVASLEHGTALLRHDAAVQNLDYLHSGRLLNSDMWFRLAEAMRQLSQTALQRAIETGFLAQQAYAYEADKDVAVIRFDYDASPEGGFLAADFLTRDLDNLDADQAQTLLSRQQQARIVISLARDAPAALADLQRDGQAVVPIPLRMLETHLPGLHNLRVGSLTVQPVALMDPLRQSIAVTHMGIGQVRRRAGSVRAQESTVGGWLPTAADRWPVAVQITPPQTQMYTGLSPADADLAAPTTTKAQRNPFEGVAAASAWHLELSAERNGIIDGSLADVLLTFVVTAGHDAALAGEIDGAYQPPDVRTQYLSAAENFADSYYDFQRSGDLTCTITRDLLGPRTRTARLCNVGFTVVPDRNGSTFTALTSQVSARFQVHDDATTTWLDPVPDLRLAVDGVGLHAELHGAASVHWDFGDHTTADGMAVDHDYTRQGAYQLSVTATYPAGSIAVWTADVVADPTAPPVVLSTPAPTLAARRVPPGKGPHDPTDPVDENASVVTASLANAAASTVAAWRLDGAPAIRGATAAWKLNPGFYQLDVSATRTLTATVACNQRHARASALPAQNGVLCTNRTFDSLGSEQAPANRNPLAQQLFDGGELTAADTWHFALPLADNPFLRSLDSAGRPCWAWPSIRDVVLVLEHDDGPLVGESALPATYGWEFVGATAYTAKGSTSEILLDRLRPGDTAWLVVRAVNLGTATWTPAQVTLQLTSTDQSIQQVALIEPTVATGEVGSFEYAFTAPDVSGTHHDTATLTVPEPALGGGQLSVDYTVQTGLNAAYYAGVNFDVLILERIDDQVDIALDPGQPQEFGPENCSIRWTGMLHPPTAGDYTIVSYGDDGVRVDLAGTRVIDDWNAHAPTRNASAPRTLAAGVPQPIIVEYFNGASVGTVKLCWIPPGGAEETIPNRHLSPLPAGR